MFRRIAKHLGDAEKLFLFHPADLTAVLELAWDRRADLAGQPLGHPLHRSDLTRFEDTWFGRHLTGLAAPTLPAGRPLQPDISPILKAIKDRETPQVAYDHLAY